MAENLDRCRGPWVLALIPLLLSVGPACGGRSPSEKPDAEARGGAGGPPGGSGGGEGSGGAGAVGGRQDMTGGTFGAGGTAGGAAGLGAGLGGSGGPGGTGAGGAEVVHACQGASVQTTNKSCRMADECGPIGPYKCCTSEPCWTGSAACPIPPSMCPSQSSRYQCTTASDCNPGGTCVSVTAGCPQCETRSCQYPPPPPPACTQAPDSCGPNGRCQSDGTCAPLSCADGYPCAAGSRCRPGSARADSHQCELIPCDDGWTCDENTRCTAPTAAVSHGCTVLSCAKDNDCDCGYCVNGSCSSGLGWCSYPAQ